MLRHSKRSTVNGMLTENKNLAGRTDQQGAAFQEVFEKTPVV